MYLSWTIDNTIDWWATIIWLAGSVTFLSCLILGVVLWQIWRETR